MFCDPHTPPYHALSMPLGEAPFTKRATSAATMRVRMTANRYGSGIRRSTYRTHSAVTDCMTPRRSGSAAGSSAAGSSVVAFGSSLVVIDHPRSLLDRVVVNINDQQTVTAIFRGSKNPLNSARISAPVQSRLIVDG